MKVIEQFSNYALDTNAWIHRYLDLPYEHLGDDIETGIDCFNLARLIYREILEVEIPYTTKDFGCDLNQHWYSLSGTPRVLEDNFSAKWGWIMVSKETIRPFDVVLMSIGATNAANHCAIYLPNKQILHTMMGHTSWMAPYGRYYKQYTVKVGRWNLDYERADI